MNRFLTGCLVFAALPAAASSSFPMAVKGHLQLSNVPACALCHTGGQTGMGTVNTGFGKALRDEGLTAGDDDALRTALDALAAKGTDSDADGTPDVEELKAGRNPNLADAPGVDAGTAVVPPSPKYGCGANAVPGLGGLVALMVVAGFSRRRR
jgi:hypothetical protein